MVGYSLEDRALTSGLILFQTLGDGTILKVFDGVLMEMWEVSWAWGQLKSLAKSSDEGTGGRRKLCTVPWGIF